MTEQTDTGFTPEQTNDPQYSNPTVRKIMNWMEFLLQLCKLLKSLLTKIFLWLEKWETHIQNRKASPVS
ncbi:MAG: hypothetical protein IJ325_06885 [Clostridia bacterium]|nr:hypothetical protein [Clostridia bacterium]